MLKGFTHARLACGCRIAFREGVEGSPVTVVVDEKSPTDSGGESERGTFTLDSEVSQLLTTKGNSGAGAVAILRGNSKSG